jgi:hypothetical protein
MPSGYMTGQGSTTRCKRHGGGKRFEELGCVKATISSADRYIAHGGGKRCEELGCGKIARGSTCRFFACPPEEGACSSSIKHGFSHSLRQRLRGVTEKWLGWVG